MRLRFDLSFVTCAGVLIFSRVVQAQPVARSEGVQKPSVVAGETLHTLTIDAQNVDDLRALPALREAWNRATSTWRRAPDDPDGVSLDASQRDLEARPLALQALARWTSAGGIVLLHTDAAQLFGFKTTLAREGTPQLAGQMFGRARAALPFAAHPLLSAQEPVEMVFYRLKAGDALVADSPNGVPLLRVTDLPLLSTGTSQPPAYAAAMAPFGRGWAVFVPRTIETHRADGATFAANLQTFIRQSAPDEKRAPDAFVGVPSSLITSASDSLRPALPPAGAPASSNTEDVSETAQSRDSVASAKLQKALLALNTASVEAGLASLLEIAPQEVPAAQALPKAPLTGAQVAREMLKQSAASQTSLLLSRGEAAAAWSLSHAINTAVALRNRPTLAAGQTQAVPTLAQETVWRTKLSALLLVWRARLEWQQARSDVRDKEADNRANAALSWLQLASQIVPNASEVGLWRGIIVRGRAADITLASPERARILNQAVASWRAALTNQPLAPDDFAQQAVAAATQASIAAQIAYDAELDKARTTPNR